MAAHGDDLRYFYSEILGDSVIKTASASAASLAVFTLAPGRYIVSYGDVAGTPKFVWAQQKKAGATDQALAAAPATPFEIALRPNQYLFVTMVRPRPLTRTGEDAEGQLDTLYFRTDIGTCLICVTKISRD